MSKALRLSEKWFQRGLWLVAFVFAAFLIGLGSTVVGDLPQVEKTLTQDDFIEQPAAPPARESLKTAERIEYGKGIELWLKTERYFPVAVAAGTDGKPFLKLLARPGTTTTDASAGASYYPR